MGGGSSRPALERALWERQAQSRSTADNNAEVVGANATARFFCNEPSWDMPMSDSSSSRCSSSSSPENTLIIFDWDDTLLCSSALDIAVPDDALMLQLEETVQAILRTAMRFGETMIVTNGCATWVQESSRRFLPGLAPTLHNMTVMSARAEYEHKYPDDPFSWKRCAFRRILKGKRVAGDLNLIVLGDSPAEMFAAHNATKVLHIPALLKTVKFMEEPSATQLLGQLRRIAQELGKIVYEEASVSKGLAPRSSRQESLDAWASGWNCEDWSSGEYSNWDWPSDEASDYDESEGIAAMGKYAQSDDRGCSLLQGVNCGHYGI